ncbi:hypothetical protein [Anaeromyxobacter oryzisoli]|uniref:hypothetical protein n=1 Tax=Anaeromyxobacter oryzisoli TaxID=2925408 RepID=UPI001F5A3D4E|nr:hypothetical protein [Anaeromyxobacter sp. SG63]
MDSRSGRARRARAVAGVAALLVVACGGGGGPVYTASGVIGSYTDGSGRVGIAVVATLHDTTGAGPTSPWAVTLSDENGAIATGTYDVPADASYAAWWWPEAALRSGARYALAFSDGDRTVRAPLELATLSPLALPAPTLDAAAGRIDWPGVPEAAAYACRVYSEGVLALAVDGPETTCDVSSLPPGAYAASILALRAPLAALATDGGARSLPPRFDVSESRLSFVRPVAGDAAVVARAAGGAFDFGTSSPGLALWLSIGAPDGTPTPLEWQVAVTGPQLTADRPLTFTYHASFPREMVWSYDIPATAGTYGLTATSGTLALQASFTVGSAEPLPYPLDAVATAGAQGAASVTWGVVPGARAYLAEVWDSQSSQFVTSAWVAAPPAPFPAGTFTAGRTYTVYVSATDADMLGGAVPSQVSVSQYPYLPGSFVAL